MNIQHLIKNIIISALLIASTSFADTPQSNLPTEFKFHLVKSNLDLNRMHVIDCSGQSATSETGQSKIPFARNPDGSIDSNIASLALTHNTDFEGKHWAQSEFICQAKNEGYKKPLQYIYSTTRGDNSFDIKLKDPTQVAAVTFLVSGAGISDRGLNRKVEHICALGLFYNLNGNHGWIIASKNQNKCSVVAPKIAKGYNTKTDPDIQLRKGIIQNGVQNYSIVSCTYCRSWAKVKSDDARIAAARAGGIDAGEKITDLLLEILEAAAEGLGG